MKYYLRTPSGQYVTKINLFTADLSWEKSDALVIEKTLNYRMLAFLSNLKFYAIPSSDKPSLLEDLKVLRKNIYFLKDSMCGGICSFLSTESNGKEFLNLAKKWPKHSKDYYYPVPSPNSRVYKTAKSAYSVLYKWDREYGESRISLLNFVIEILESERANEIN